ncbi:ATPase family protein, partial [Lachnospiraceae bacterium oral taxon 082 str. F0431]
MSNDLQELFKKFMEKYESELNAAYKDKEAGKAKAFSRPFASKVRNDIPKLIRAQLTEKIYKVEGSVGQGNWAKVPWIGVFDKRVTTSAQRGVYIVYLLNKTTKELFLTLNQGVTDVITASNSKAADNLQNRAQSIRSKIGSFPGLESSLIGSGSKDYDAGCIYYIKYTLDSLPEDEKLYSDLYKFIEVYKAYYDKVFLTSEENDVQVEEGEGELQVGQQIERIFEYINSKGFVYDEKLLKNFYLSLKSKPFVLLAGTSGTGKTRLVRLFAEAIGAYGSGRYKQIAVKPDWSDSMDLFGHVNLDNKFVPGAIVEFIKKAADDSDKLPHILCLDEMNLARVEYYFSDFLSIIETRDLVEDEIVTDNLVPKICYSGDEDAEKLYSNLMIPENLYIIGTVRLKMKSRGYP